MDDLMDLHEERIKKPKKTRFRRPREESTPLEITPTSQIIPDEIEL